MVSPRNRRESTDASPHFRKFQRRRQVQIHRLGAEGGAVVSTPYGTGRARNAAGARPHRMTDKA